MSKEIQITRGMVALVDDEDFKRMNQFKWHANKGGKTFYAARNVSVDGKRHTEWMHRALLGVPKGLCVDHINHNGLDNRRENLRVCTNTENWRNQRKPSDAKTSRYKGVYFDKGNRKWTARIGEGGKHYLGTFLDEVEAARAYDAKAVELYGEFAYLNFPKGIIP